MTRTLGRLGLTVSALGLGCMGMSYAYGPADRAESITTIHLPIPGTKRRRYLQENTGSLGITLSAEDLARLSDLKPSGERYPDMSGVNGDTAR